MDTQHIAINDRKQQASSVSVGIIDYPSHLIFDVFSI